MMDAPFLSALYVAAAFQSDWAGGLVTFGFTDWGFRYGLTKASRPSRTTTSQEIHVDRALAVVCVSLGVTGALSVSRLVVFMCLGPAAAGTLSAFPAVTALTAVLTRVRKAPADGAKTVVEDLPQPPAMRSAKEDPVPGRVESIAPFYP